MPGRLPASQRPLDNGAAAANTPRMFLDDLPEGYRFDTGSRTLSEADILAFAREHDPQPFHLDREAAEATHFGGLIASGFHTLLTAFALTLEADIWNEASLGSPGMDKLRWLKPVRPGDSLRVSAEVRSSTPSAHAPIAAGPSSPMRSSTRRARP